MHGDCDISQADRNETATRLQKHTYSHKNESSSREKKKKKKKRGEKKEKKASSKLDACREEVIS